MKYGKHIVSGILTLAVILCSLVFSVVSKAAQQVCSGNVLGTFNGSPACMSGDNLHICSCNFPDDSFRACISNYMQGIDPYNEQKIDVNGDGLLTESEAAELQYIRCESQGIADLRGIEFFTAARLLYCYDNLLTELDVSKNPDLYNLNCSGNQLVKLDITSNPDLWGLYCDDNQLTELDVSGHTDLYSLSCSNNRLTALSLGYLPYLGFIGCSNNQLEELDVSQCPDLEVLRCSGNKLTGIDVSNNPWLYGLECDNNQLTTLNVDNGLYDLSCANNQIEYLHLSHCEEMDYFNCIGNPLIELELPEKIPSLEGMVLAYGTCSYDYDTYWRFDEHQELTIYGSGNMDDYPVNEYVPQAPYYDIREGIQSISVEEGITHIGARAFADCYNLTSVSVADTVISVGENAFDGCRKLTTVCLPNEMESIGQGAFSECMMLTNVTLPSGIQEIESYTFMGCYNLGRIQIPQSVNSIADSAFVDSGVTEFVVDADNASYSSIDGVLFDKAGTTLIAYPGKGKPVYTVPQGVTTIGSVAFAMNGAIERLILPSSVSFIEAEAFQECAYMGAPLHIYIENPDLQFGERVCFMCESYVTFYGAAGSRAEQYAQEYGITFVPVQAYTLESITQIDNYVFHMDAKGGAITNVAVDGVFLDAADFSVQDADAAIVLSEAYAQSLPDGRHTVAVFFGDGYAACTFTTGFESVVCGDADGDGEVSDWDAIILNRYLAGWDVDIYLSASDVDGDGEVSDWDAILLARYLAGWNISLGG